jgi:hypothetical protein
MTFLLFFGFTSYILMVLNLRVNDLIPFLETRFHNRERHIRIMLFLILREKLHKDSWTSVLNNYIRKLGFIRIKPFLLGLYQPAAPVKIIATRVSVNVFHILPPMVSFVFMYILYHKSFDL